MLSSSKVVHSVSVFAKCFILSRCGDFAKDSLRPVGLFQLEPTEHQVVFEGDPIKLKCRVQVASSQKVRIFLEVW
jgi:hypothetical protein